MNKSPREEFYHEQEFECETKLTDADMLRMHIDIALRDGDKERFLYLTERLKEVAE